MKTSPPIRSIIIIIFDLIKDYRNINLHLDLVLWTYCSVVLVVVSGFRLGYLMRLGGRGVIYIYSKKK